ncbi:MAG: hypothetical protein M1839_003953 [Geoglossum umbratile]|nr:MAG: hypothetical protein M1839_003953 [Geoglossum umbratile]
MDQDNHASRGSLSKVEFSSDPNVLCINGVGVDKTARLTDLSHALIDREADIRTTAGPILESRLKNYQLAFDLARNHPTSPYPTSALDEAFWRTAVADTDPSGESSTTKDGESGSTGHQAQRWPTKRQAVKNQRLYQKEQWLMLV